MKTLKFVGRKMPTANECWVRHFINVAFNEADNLVLFRTIFLNQLNHFCKTGNKHKQNAELFYKFSKSDKAEHITDYDYTEIEKGYIVYVSDKSFRVIAEIDYSQKPEL